MNYHTLSAYHRCCLAALAAIAVCQTIPCLAQEDQSITMTVSKDHYSPGDTVQLQGVVSGGPGALVALQVKDSDGSLILIRTVQADQGGNFAIQFKIPLTATSGKFSATASAKVNGFVLTQDKIFDATVPEFAGAVPVMLAGFAAIVLYRNKIERIPASYH